MMMVEKGGEVDHLVKFDALLEAFDDIGKEAEPEPTVEPRPDEPGRF
jgi:hypothetical protein